MSDAHSLPAPPGEALIEEMASAIERVIGDRSLADVANGLNALANEHQVMSRKGRVLKYDPATILSWRSKRSPVSRQAAWLLDLYFGTGSQFQTLRDRYILATDRGESPAVPLADDPVLLDASRCLADEAASSLERVPLKLASEQTLAFAFFSVVDCSDARSIVRSTARDRKAKLRLIGIYDLLGRWDLAVKMAVPPAAALNDEIDRIHRALVENEVAKQSVDALESGNQQDSLESVERARQREFAEKRWVRTERYETCTGREPESILARSEDYDRLRVQRSMLFIECSTVTLGRRPKLAEELTQLLHSDEESTGIIEAVAFAQDAIVLELLMTCATRSLLNQLNRAVEDIISRFFAQKYNLLFYGVEEETR